MDLLGHIARMPDHRALKQYIFQLSTNDTQFVPGFLLDGTSFRNSEEIVAAATDRNHWRRVYGRLGYSRTVLFLELSNVKVRR